MLTFNHNKPFSDYDYSGLDGIVAGWGATAESGKSSCGLRQVNVPILSNLDCSSNTNYRNISFIMSKNMLCAGFERGGADSCQVSPICFLRQ